MLAALLLTMALQDASAPPRDAPPPKCAPGLTGLACSPDYVPLGASNAPACSVDVAGHLLYPAYATPIPHTNVEIVAITPMGIHTIDLFTDTWNQFHVTLGASGIPEYWVVVNAEGMELLRERIWIPRECKPDPGISLDILLHPAIKLSDNSEDTVAVETLARKVPDKASSTPDYYEANIELGLAYKKDNKPQDAVRTLTHALQLNSGSMLARAALGEYAFDKGDFPTAADLLSQAARLGSLSPDVYYMLGTSYYKLNQLDLAEGCLMRALSIAPSIGKAYLQLYNVYMKAKMPEKALKAADTYLEKYPNTGDHDYVQAMADKLRKALKPNDRFR